MKTLFVGDIHLKASVILPIVKEQMVRHNCSQVIFTGDYVDLTGKKDDSKLYRENLRQLIEFKKEIQAEGKQVINLIGNHDVAYICDDAMQSSCSDNTLFNEVGDLLMELGFQVAFEVEGYIVSHAGYTIYNKPDAWHLNKFMVKDIQLLDNLNNIAGKSRGGIYEWGGPLWADLHMDLIEFFNPHYKKQVVGHSNVSTIDIHKNIIGIDSFGVYPKGDNWLDLGYTSDGSMLIIEEGVPKRIETNYTKPETKEKLVELLNRGIY